MLKQMGTEWCVFTKDGSKKLGCHPTKADAEKHLAAIDAHMKSIPMEGTQERTTAAPAQIVEGDKGPAHLVGYAAVFNQETVIDMGFMKWREQVSPGAFDQTLAGKADVRAAVNHSANHVIGRTKSKTLTLSVDEHGLRYDVTLPNTSAGRDALEQVRRGDLDGSSFKFRVPEDGSRIVDDGESHPEGLPLLALERVDLIDVGPVSYPAYEGTSVSARMIPDAVQTWYAERQTKQRAALAQAKADLAAAQAWQG